MLRKRAPLFKPNVNSGSSGSTTAAAPTTKPTTNVPVADDIIATESTQQLDTNLPPPPSQPDSSANTQALVVLQPAQTTPVAESQALVPAPQCLPIPIVSQPPLVIKTSADKNKLMKDLLFHNPPLTKKQKRLRKKLSKAVAAREKKAREVAEQQKDQDNQDDNDDEEQEQSIAPQVRLAANGELVLDERSLVIERRNKLKDKEAIIEDSDDIIGSTSYASFRRKPMSSGRSKWLEQDTRKFFRALSICGTDFSLMESLIFKGSRSRTELHKKFKREEKTNRAKVDLALTNVISMSTGELEEVVGTLGVEV